MADLTQRTQCSVMIDDGWLADKVDDHDAYFDLRELWNREGGYYDWYKTRYGEKDANVHAAQANFTQTGMRLNDDTRFWVKCQFTSDTHAERRYFAPGITHPNGVTKVYAHRTSARGIEIVGVPGNIS